MGLTRRRFDRLLDALNRLPRPAFAMGALAFFTFAMAAPDAFARRMVALASVPQPLWWLLGGVVSFHFGAREAYYHRDFRTRDTGGPMSPDTAADMEATGVLDGKADGVPGADAPNPARDAMRAART